MLLTFVFLAPLFEFCRIKESYLLPLSEFFVPQKVESMCLGC